jgi:hypothetical protein
MESMIFNLFVQMCCNLYGQKTIEKEKPKLEQRHVLHLTGSDSP